MTDSLKDISEPSSQEHLARKAHIWRELDKIAIGSKGEEKKLADTIEYKARGVLRDAIDQDARKNGGVKA